MLNIKGIGRRLLRCNRNITIFSIASVLIGTMLILEMMVLLLNTNLVYERDMKALYGDCDVGIYYSDYSEIDDSIIHTLEQDSNVVSLSTIFYSNELNLLNASTYIIGTDNSEMVRSRYHFKSVLEQNQVAMNKILAEVLSCDVGEVLNIGERSLEVVEIFEDGTLSEAAVEMLVVNKDTLNELCKGKTNTNIIMLQVKDDTESKIEELILGIDHKLNVLIFGTDEAYLKSVSSFGVYIIILAICVVIATCLFTATVFKTLLYKYRRSMAVLRMVGSSPKQIKNIFLSMLRSIILSGVSGGLILVLLTNSLFLKTFNERWKLIDGEMELFCRECVLISIGIYFIIRFILQVMANQFNNSNFAH